MQEVNRRPFTRLLLRLGRYLYTLQAQQLHGRPS